MTCARFSESWWAVAMARTFASNSYPASGVRAVAVHQGHALGHQRAADRHGVTGLFRDHQGVRGVAQRGVVG